MSPRAPLKDHLLHHLSKCCHCLSWSLILFSTHPRLVRQWDWLDIDGQDLNGSLLLSRAGISFLKSVPGLLIFGFAIALGVVPACTLICAVHLVSMFMQLLRLLIGLHGIFVGTCLNATLRPPRSTAT
ncbi:uncharacterized protein F4822DRAFT_435430 [Hypoxylon trugodes]|uniref:uncharacterized protein n=1 Tax=Hypoxylon trugodes TaxID=326681 RepID=UPI00219EC630|nr:uncharacterized protein F4822DRAFT_435430 [Hypoxylon trugodes]KAI1382580.1 hypothetical protein F4822DRAFT_435430 [Hypoxylon trugodes]